MLVAAAAVAVLSIYQRFLPEWILFSSCIVLRGDYRLYMRKLVMLW
jgi:hypothetical protein